MGRELKRTAELMHGLRTYGAKIYPLIGSRNAPKGWPDRFIAHDCWSGFVEFKEDEGLLSIEQYQMVKYLREVMPGMCFVARLLDKTIDIEDEQGHRLATVPRDARAFMLSLREFKRLS